MNKPKNFVGKSTEDNLTVGTSLATALEIDAMINHYHVKFSKLNTIITGGDAVFWFLYLKIRYLYTPI